MALNYGDNYYAGKRIGKERVFYLLTKTKQ